MRVMCILTGDWYLKVRKDTKYFFGLLKKTTQVMERKTGPEYLEECQVIDIIDEGEYYTLEGYDETCAFESKWFIPLTGEKEEESDEEELINVCEKEEHFV